MKTLQFEVLLDEYTIGRIVRAGDWVLTTFPDGHGEWNWEPIGVDLARPLERYYDLKREEAKLKLCLKHPRAVVSDGPCPACAAEREFDELYPSH